MQSPVQRILVTFPFCCIPSTHVLPACSRGRDILAEAAAYDLSSPSTSAWKVRKILCERFFSLKASLRELGKEGKQDRWRPIHSGFILALCDAIIIIIIYFKKRCLRKGWRELGVSWLGFKTWYAAIEPDIVLWGERNLKRKGKKERKKKTLPKFGKGQQSIQRCVVPCQK